MVIARTRFNEGLRLRVRGEELVCRAKKHANDVEHELYVQGGDIVLAWIDVEKESVGEKVLAGPVEMWHRNKWIEVPTSVSA